MLVCQQLHESPVLQGGSDGVTNSQKTEAKALTPA